MRLQFSPLLAILTTVARISVLVDGHGLLTVPSSKNGGTITTPNGDTGIHYAIASYGIIDKAFFDNDHSKTPWTRPGEFNHELARDLIPGHPETLHPCGCNAANNVGYCAGVSQASGFGETIQGNTITPASWSRGSTQETAWNAWVNHAGGHIYMLCKKSQFDSCRDTLLPSNTLQATQVQQDAYLECVWDCFESNTLEWDDTFLSVGENWSQKLQYRDDRCTYATMDPTTKVGKDGHLWRYTPIPDSQQITNGGEGKCTWDSVTSFSNAEAREEFVASFGEDDVCDSGPDSHAPPDWHVFDKVKVPMEIEEGEYLLSWRWEGYMADQMWTSCADVTIAPPGSSSSAAEDNGCVLTPTTSTPTKSPTKQTLRPTSTESPTNAPPAPHTPPPSSPPVITPKPTTRMPVPAPTPKHTPMPVITNKPTPKPIVASSSPTKSSPSNCPSGYSGIRPYDGCTKYHHCRDGQILGAINDCPAGTLFDVDLQYCNWASLVTCQVDVPGCYSNNFKDCNHHDFQVEDASCNTIWLPDGGRTSCIALWGSCTNQGVGSCCEPAECYQGSDGSYAQCIVPSS